MLEITYEAPAIIEIGDAENMILGSGDWILDADNETRLL